MHMKHIEKYLGIALLIFALGFNFWTYRSEPSARLDPNDNTFQFALVDRTNQIWDYANTHCKSIFPTNLFCKISLLTDHWVPNWAEGYNLPYYYSHIPQIAIVASYRLFQTIFQTQLLLFSFYHLSIFTLLCIFPLSLFLALRIIGLSWIASGIGATIASHLSTDGLYGLDPASFLWRGFGLSSQLFAMIWFPLAIATAWRCLKTPSGDVNAKAVLVPILFLAATTAGHLGIGIIAFITIGMLYLSPLLLSFLTHSIDKTILDTLKTNMVKLIIMFTGVGLLLGYWIVPILKDSNYHNISVWDPIWKFDSYGYREVLKNLFNGDIFDFGRFPTLSILVVVGIFVALHSPLSGFYPFAFLLIFWVLLYFGRTTWGGLIDIIPGMKEFHISRFIVGVHMSGLFLIPLVAEWIITKTHKTTRVAVGILCSVIIVLAVYPQTLRYAKHNDFLIDRANTNYKPIASDSDNLIQTLKNKLVTNSGRVYFGRGGNWGKNFRVAETPYYLYASTFGIPTVLWLPQTWSPNSDTEQFFSDNRESDYTLYNVRYVVTPPDLGKAEIQPFWKPLAAGHTWKLYEVETDGYITSGIRPVIVSVDKETYINLVHLWITSDAPKIGLYPELTFDKNYPKKTGFPNFRMIDNVTYTTPSGGTQNLFADQPIYGASQKCNKIDNVIILSQKSTSDMIFEAKVKAERDCPDSLVVLRQTYHPSWHATIDGKPAKTISVFPFYTAVVVETAGNHTIQFAYKPSVIKQTLLILAFISIGLLFGYLFYKKDSSQ